MLFFLWQKQSGTDGFNDLAFEYKVMWDRSLHRNPHFKSILILLPLSQKDFDILILETFILTAEIADSFRQASKQGAPCHCK